MYDALAAQGCEVRHIGHTLRPWSARIPYLPQFLVRAAERRRNAQESILETAVTRARALERELARAAVDVLFAPVASVEIAFLRTALPIAYLSDSTSRLLSAYYPVVMAFPEQDKRDQEVCEQRAIGCASLLVYPTQWAAQSAIDDYGADPARVRLIPFGANMHCSASTAERLIAGRKPEASCNLLFVGKDWERKGGDIAIETLDALLARGIDVHLTLCTEHSPGALGHARARLIGPLDPRDPRQRSELNQLFMQTDFLVVPSRAECFGVVYCEAAAYGVPALGTQTGGIPAIITNGVTGFTLPLEARGNAYAELIGDLLADPARYRAMATAARKGYEERLNWTVWGRTVATELRILRDARISQRKNRPH